MEDERRFSGFTDDEVYILLRQAIEACPIISLSDPIMYSEAEKQIHKRLLVELSEEKKFRWMKGFETRIIKR